MTDRDESCEDCAYGLENSYSMNCGPCMKEYRISGRSPNFVRWNKEKR